MDTGYLNLIKYQLILSSGHAGDILNWCYLNKLFKVNTGYDHFLCVQIAAISYLPNGYRIIREHMLYAQWSYC